MKGYPISKTQEQVLKALGMTATDFGDAERKFKKLGLVVSNRREGRNTIPVIQVLDRYGGGWNAGGDGESCKLYDDIDTSAISQWIAK